VAKSGPGHQPGPPGVADQVLTIDRSESMRFGSVEVRPLGGGVGCLAMILLSLVLSALLTLIVNVLL
jgi:hypothetical protein